MGLKAPAPAAVERAATRLDRLNEWLGRGLAWLTLLMVLTTFTIVVLRYAFDTGWIAMQESVNYMHAMVFMLGAAYAWRHGAHVRVDIFYTRFTPTTRAWIDLLGNLIFLLPVCAFLLWISLDYVAAAWRIREGSGETGGLPLAYLLKTVIPLTAVLLAVQGVADTLRRLVTLLSAEKPTENG